METPSHKIEKLKKKKPKYKTTTKSLHTLPHRQLEKNSLSYNN